MAHSKECASEKHDAFSLSYTLFVFAVLLPFGTWFARRFWRAVNAAQPPVFGVPVAVPRLTRMAVNAFIVASTSMLWLGAYQYVFLPLSQQCVANNFYNCVATNFAIKLSYVSAYTALHRTLLERIKLVFANSTQPVSARVATAFDVVQCSFLLCVAVMVYIATEPCVASLRFYENPKWTFKMCKTRSPMAAAVALYTVLVLAANLLLAWMYLSRLKRVFIDDNCRRLQPTLSASKSKSMSKTPASKSKSKTKTPTTTEAENTATDITLSSTPLSKKASKHVVMALELMRQSTVVSIWSVASSILTMLCLLLPLRTLSPFFDVVLNEVLMYCLFTFGDNTYDRLFGFCHFTVDCCLPQHALEIEDQMAIDMMSPLRTTIRRRPRDLDAISLSLGVARSTHTTSKITTFRSDEN